MKREFKKIGTHDGKFHADEVMATAILNEIFDTELIRTRNKDILDKLDIVYDVNGGELDHHGIDKRLRDDGIPFSSCGLVWDKYGRDLLKFKYKDLSDEDIEDVFNYIDRSLIEGIDALDNGIWIGKGEIPLMNISTILSSFNPLWYEEGMEDDRFNESVKFATSILNNKINFKISVFKAKEKVIKAYETRKIPEVIILETYCPYIEALKEVDKNSDILFVIFKTKNNYIIQTVRGEDGEDIKKLPKAWMGKRDKELQDITGVNDAVFCHTGRFIAAAESLEGIIKLAKLAIEEPDEKRKLKTSKFMRFIKGLFLKK
ncbi:MYG1 family protein [Clostridium sp. cel8]|nr:MYG1 family protein [Clostridium sp. cel8]